MSAKEDLQERIRAHREGAEERAAERREAEAARRPAPRRREHARGVTPAVPVRRPRFQRGLRWIAVRPIVLGKDAMVKPGELIPQSWSGSRLRRLHRTQQIGPIGSRWSELMIRAWEDQVLSRALAKLEGEALSKAREEWGAELEDRRKARLGLAERQLREEQELIERERAERQERRARRAAEQAELERRALAERHRLQAERQTEIDRIREEVAAESGAELEAIRARREAEEAGDEPPSDAQRAALESLAAAHGATGDEPPVPEVEQEPDPEREQEAG